MVEQLRIESTSDLYLGKFDPKTGTMTLNHYRIKESPLYTVLHETGHALASANGGILGDEYVKEWWPNEEPKGAITPYVEWVLREKGWKVAAQEAVADDYYLQRVDITLDQERQKWLEKKLKEFWP